MYICIYIYIYIYALCTSYLVGGDTGGVGLPSIMRAAAPMALLLSIFVDYCCLCVFMFDYC